MDAAANGGWYRLRAIPEKRGIDKSYRFLARQVKTGKLKAARIGERGELFTCDSWVDAWMEDAARMVVVPARRRA